MPDHQVDEELEKGTIKTCLLKDLGSSKLPLEMECVYIHCYENNPPDSVQLLFDSMARWTVHLHRPSYVERNKLRTTCNQFRRFVPVDTKVPSVEQKYLRTAAQKYLQVDDDSKGMLLDLLAPEWMRCSNPIAGQLSRTARIAQRIGLVCAALCQSGAPSSMARTYWADLKSEAN